MAYTPSVAAEGEPDVCGSGEPVALSGMPFCPYGGAEDPPTGGMLFGMPVPVAKFPEHAPRTIAPAAKAPLSTFIVAGDVRIPRGVMI